MNFIVTRDRRYYTRLRMFNHYAYVSGMLFLSFIRNETHSSNDGHVPRSLQLLIASLTMPRIVEVSRQFAALAITSFALGWPLMIVQCNSLATKTLTDNHSFNLDVCRLLRKHRADW